MKASHLNLMCYISALFSVSTSQSFQLGSVCVCASVCVEGSGDGRPHTFTETSEGTEVCSKQTTKIMCMCIILSEGQIQTCFFGSLSTHNFIWTPQQKE